MDTLCGLSLTCTAIAVLVVWLGVVIESFAPRFAHLADVWAMRIAMVMLLSAASLLLAAGIGEGRKPMPAVSPAVQATPPERPEINDADSEGSRPVPQGTGNGVRRLPPLPSGSGDWIDLGEIMGYSAKVRVY